MNEEYSTKVKLRRIILISVSFLILFVPIYVFFTVSAQLTKYQSEIQAALSKEIGLPISFGKIKTDWQGVTLGIALDEVVIDAKAPLIIKKVFVAPLYYELIFKQELKWDHIELDGLKATISDFTSLELNEGSFSTNISVGALQTLLNLESRFIIKDAEIDWVGKDLKIKQWISGKLRARGISATPGFDTVRGFIFKGTQSFQIAEGNKTPEFKFKVKFDPKTNSLKMEMDSGGLGAECYIAMQNEKKVTSHCAIQINNLAIKDFGSYFPEGIYYPAWIKWLKNALQEGTITDGSVNFQGVNKNFKWDGEILFQNLNINYDKAWEKIKNASGAVKIATNKVEVKITEGNIFGVPIQILSAIIDPIGAPNKNPVVQIDGKLKTQFETGVSFLVQSPLKNTVGKAISSLNPKGPMDLHLQLTIPLDEKPVAVTGTVTTKNANLKLSNADIEIKSLKGEFDFTQNSLSATGVHLNMLEHPLEMSIETLHENSGPLLNISTIGNYTTEFLKTHMHSTLLDKLEGESQFTISLKVPMTEIKKSNEIEWTIFSSMQGIKIDLPEPIGKNAKENRLTTLTLFPLEAEEQSIQLHMESTLDAKLVLSNAEKPILKRGNIVFGGRVASTWTTKEKLYVLGSIPLLRVNDWLDVLEKKGASSINIPMEIQLYAKQMEAFSIILHDTQLFHSTQKQNVWRVEGPLVKGTLSLPSENEKKYNLNFDYLKLKAENKESSLVPELLAKQERVPIEFDCKELQFNDMRFGRVSVRLIPKSYGYEIKNLKARTSIFEILGSGEWHVNELYTSLKGQMVGSNMGAALAGFGFPSAIDGSRGVITYDFNWLGSPLEFKFSKVRGQLSVKLDNGSLIGVDQGLGRIMGLLNNPLNFASVLKKGFEFNKIRGAFNLKDGLAETNRLSVEGTSAQIEIEGSTNLKSKELDLKMLVTPKVMGVGTLGAAITPVVPFVGVPMMVFDKLTGSKLTGSIQYKYSVSGTWDSPRVETMGEVKRRLRKEERE